MSHDPLLVAPAVVAPPVTVDPAAVPAETPPAPSEEQVRAADAVFAARTEEERQVAALLGLYTGVLVGHDLLREALAPDEDEDEDGAEKPKLNEKEAE
jgi:hypothetical protein